MERGMVDRAEKRRLRQQGIDRYRSSSRQSTSIEVIIAAAKRGWNAKQIAIAAGVSFQTISERLRKYEERYGAIKPVVPGPKRIFRGRKHLWTCAGCGKSEWSFEKGVLVYCSAECQENCVRQITDEMVDTAIQLRLSGASWKLIAGQIGFWIQTVQIRIWTYLYREGKLNRDVVDDLWMKGNHPNEGYSWLEKTTGLVPVDGGTLLTSKQYADRKNQTAWSGFKRNVQTLEEHHNRG
jgi:hypothetical protein